MAGYEWQVLWLVHICCGNWYSTKDTESLSCDEPASADLAWASQGLLMATINIHWVQCPVLLWVWQQFDLVCDDPRNTVLMMPPLLSHNSWEEARSRKRWKFENTVGQSCMGGEGKGELVWLAKFAWIRACVKSDCWIIQVTA